MKHSTFNIQLSTLIVAIALCLGALVVGCAHLQPGADPVVVNAERLETSARATFNFVTEVDAANRTFYATNAPAFHKFVEWLRTPVEVRGTNIIRRGPAMILAVDAAKISYQNNVTQSNLLQIAVSDLTDAVMQAQAWQTIIKTPTPK